MVFMGRAPARGLVQVVLVRRHRQDGDALVDQLEHVGRAGLAADGALLGVAVVDADIADVLHVEVFNGYLYLCAKPRNGMTQHYYLDGSPDGAANVDEHCPHSDGLIKKAGKEFLP